MRFLRTVFSVGALILLIVPQTGCVVAAVAAGAGAGIAYVRGASVLNVEGTPEQVATAAEQAFWQMGLVVVSSRSDSAGAEVIGRTARDDKIDVTVESEAPEVSKVSVRVGVFGNRTFQNRILVAITENLAAARTEVPAEPPMEPPPGEVPTEPPPEPPAEPPPADTRGGGN